MTALLMAKLQQSHILSLSDPVTKFLPNRCQQNRCKDILLLNLLAHTSGISNQHVNDWIEAQLPYELIIERTLSAPKACLPGTCFQYNNVAFALVREVIEKVIGKPYWQIMKEYLLTPLTMTGSSATYAELITSGHYFHPHLFLNQKFIETEHSKAYYAFAASSAINSNLEDMLAFLKAELKQNPLYLSESSILPLHQAQAIANDFKEWVPAYALPNVTKSSYGLGHRLIQYRGLDVIFHGGWLKGSKNIIAIIPQEQLGFVFLQDTGSNANYQVMFEILDFLATLSTK